LRRAPFTRCDVRSRAERGGRTYATERPKGATRALSRRDFATGIASPARAIAWPAHSSSAATTRRPARSTVVVRVDRHGRHQPARLRTAARRPGRAARPRRVSRTGSSPVYRHTTVAVRRWTTPSNTTAPPAFNGSAPPSCWSQPRDRRARRTGAPTPLPLAQDWSKENGRGRRLNGRRGSPPLESRREESPSGRHRRHLHQRSRWVHPVGGPQKLADRAEEPEGPRPVEGA